MALANFTIAIAQYDDNSVWVGSTAKANLFLEAAMWLQVHRSQFTMRQNSQMNFEVLQKNIDKAHDYLRVVSDTASANRAPFVKGKPR